MINLRKKQTALTDFQKNISLEQGFFEKDFRQILEAINKTTYELNEEEIISKEKVIEILGEKKYMWGILRSAFHFTAVQHDDKNKNEVSFNSSVIFKQK